MVGEVGPRSGLVVGAVRIGKPNQRDRRVAYRGDAGHRHESPFRIVEAHRIDSFGINSWHGRRPHRRSRTASAWSGRSPDPSGHPLRFPAWRPNGNLPHRLRIAAYTVNCVDAANTFLRGAPESKCVALAGSPDRVARAQLPMCLTVVNATSAQLSTMVMKSPH